MRPTDTEKSGFKCQLRYEHACKFLLWDIEFREIGMLFLVSDCPLSMSLISRTLNISRPTISRRLQVMIENKLVTQGPEGYAHSELGRAFHVTLHREIDRIAHGLSKGLTPATIKALSGLVVSSELFLKEIENINFPKHLRV